MYLYLGQDTVINTKEIVGIFDLENTSTSKETKRYLAAAQKNGHVREVSMELPKSFVVCEKDEAHTVYLSQISPGTLEKRTRAEIGG
jgi:hypothetical protein